jgi:hypothetical protein
MVIHSSMAQALEILRFQRILTRHDGPDMEDVFRRVIKILDASGVPWCLVGAHAINTYTRPRATVDFDFIVEARRMKHVLQALEEEFGELQTTDIGPAVRITDLAVDLCSGPPFRTARSVMMYACRAPRFSSC